MGTLFSAHRKTLDAFGSRPNLLRPFQNGITFTGCVLMGQIDLRNQRYFPVGEKNRFGSDFSASGPEIHASHWLNCDPNRFSGVFQLHWKILQVSKHHRAQHKMKRNIRSYYRRIALTEYFGHLQSHFLMAMIFR
jgi:hypothetical protein